MGKTEEIFKDSLEKKKPERERFWSTLTACLIPDRYRTLCARQLSDSLGYFLRLVLLSFALAMVLILFNVAALSRSLNEEFSRFETLKVSLDYTLKEPIALERYGIIIADQKAYEGENLLITQNGSTRKPVICSFISPMCWFQNTTIQANNTIDLAADGSRSARSATIAVLLLLPTLLVLYLFYTCIVLALLVVGATILGYVINRIAGGTASIKKTFLCALYSSTIFALAHPFNMVLWTLYSVHLILFVALFTIAMMLIGERKHRYEDD